jgi:hypothetical protein
MPDNVSPPSRGTTDLASRANFIFRGTVIQINASTLAAVPASARTAIVRVDEVLAAPMAFAGYAGQNITVQLADNEHVSTGEQATFYTNGLLYGESLAVQSIGHHDASVAVPMLAAAAGDPVRALADLHLREHLATTGTVVTGTVTATRLPVAAQAATPSPVSEHDPAWHEADVTVTGVEKGSLAQNSIVVRYPSSTDVRWYMVPKLRPGMTGVFLLHTPTAGAAAETPSGGRAPQGPTTFDLLHPDDFLPIDQLPRVRALIT